jgi:hypothetical protein
MQPDGEPPLIRSVIPTGAFGELHDRRPDSQSRPASMPTRPPRLFIWGLRLWALSYIAIVLDIGVGLVGGAGLRPVVLPIAFVIFLIAFGGVIAVVFGWADLRSRWPWPSFGPERRVEYWAYSLRATREVLFPWPRRR